MNDSHGEKVSKMLEEMKRGNTQTDGREPTRWTRPLQVLTAVCAVIFMVGTILNLFVMTPDVIEQSMRLAGMSAAEAANAASGTFYTVGLVIGVFYIIGNALGVLALQGRAWVFWLAIGVNLTQGLGLLVIPPEVFQAVEAEHGTIGLLPTLIVDGGGLILAVVLIASFLKFRTSWAREKQTG